MTIINGKCKSIFKANLPFTPKVNYIDKKEYSEYEIKFSKGGSKLYEKLRLSESQFALPEHLRQSKVFSEEPI